MSSLATEAEDSSKSCAKNEGFQVPTMVPVWKKPSAEPIQTEATKEKEEKLELESSTFGSTEALFTSTASPSNSSAIASISTTATSSSTSSISKMAQPDLKAPPPLSYNEPRWSARPPQAYSLTVIKNGTVVSEIPISKKPYYVFGRLPSCDVQLEHPSISRYHAILQYRPQDKPEGNSKEEEDESSTRTSLSSSVSANPTEEGYYVYDLGSTHGTFINKTKILMRCYYRLRVGQMVKFGGSSRLFLLEVSLK